MPFTFTDPSGYAYRAGALFLGLDPATGLPVGVHTERHAITIAGARSGKGACLIIPNLGRWPHAVVTIDPKGENAARTWDARLKLGQTVAVLDPFHVSDVPELVRARFNPLADLEPYGRRVREKVLALADGLVVVHDPKHMEWVDGTRSIIAGAIAFTIATAEPEVRNLSTVRAMLKLAPDELAGVARMMMDCDACGGLASAGGGLILTALTTTGGITPQLLPKAKAATEWLDAPEIADCLSSSSFNLGDLKKDKLSLYVVLQPDDIKSYSAFFRMFVRAALKIMMTDEPEQDHRCLFLLDEFHSLGKMDTIAEAAGLMAGYGVTLWPFLQDLGQLHTLYGREGAETFFGNADAHVFFNNNDTLTLQTISNRIGKLTATEVVDTPPDRRHYNEWLRRAWEDENVAKDRIRAEDDNKVAAYNHAMRQVGNPRFTTSEIAALVGKKHTDKIARSAVVFAQGGDILNIMLEPYFKPVDPTTIPRPQAIPASQQKTFHDVTPLEWVGIYIRAILRRIFNPPNTSILRETLKVGALSFVCAYIVFFAMMLGIVEYAQKGVFRAMSVNREIFNLFLVPDLFRYSFYFMTLAIVWHHWRMTRITYLLALEKEARITGNTALAEHYRKKIDAHAARVRSLYSDYNP